MSLSFPAGLSPDLVVAVGDEAAVCPVRVSLSSVLASVPARRRAALLTELATSGSATLTTRPDVSWVELVAPLARAPLAPRSTSLSRECSAVVRCLVESFLWSEADAVATVTCSAARVSWINRSLRGAELSWVRGPGPLSRLVDRLRSAP